MTRNDILEEVLALKKNNIVITLPTGTGKSRIALEKTYKEGALFPKVLIVYPKRNLKQNWIDEYKKWGYENDIEDVTFTTYASLHKQMANVWDMVIFDEAHHISDRVLDIIKYMKFKRSLILSATLTPSHLFKLKAVFDNLYVYRVSTRQAIEGEILPDPKIILLPLILNTVDKNECIVKNPKAEKEMTIDFSKRNYYLSKTIKYIIPCTEAQFYLDMDTQVEWYKKKAIGNARLKNLWLHKAGDRLKWLAIKKTPYVKELLKKLRNQRTLTFCGSIEQTEQLGHYCIHSKNNKTNDYLNMFNKKEINHITSVAMLDEGVNLAECRVGIFANINSSERLQIQRVGRILRHEKPVIIIPFFKNTREEEIVNSMIANYNRDLIVTVNSIKDIKL